VATVANGCRTERAVELPPRNSAMNGPSMRSHPSLIRRIVFGTNRGRCSASRTPRRVQSIALDPAATAGSTTLCRHPACGYR
jgi:hypothetical protein